MEQDDGDEVYTTKYTLYNEDHMALQVVIAVYLVYSVLAILYTLVYMYFLATKMTLHRNLLYLLLHQPIITLINLIPQLCLNIDFFAGNYLDGLLIRRVLVGLSLLGILCSIFNLDAFIVERLVATILVAKYEAMTIRLSLLPVILILSEWGLAVFTYFSLYYLGTIKYVGIVLIVLSIAISFILFLFLPRITRHMNRQYLLTAKERLQELKKLPPKIAALTIHGKNATLTERYQAAENMKSARLLNSIIPVMVALLAFACVFYVVGLYLENPSLARSLVNQCFYFLITTSNVVVMTIVLLRIPYIQKIQFCKMSRRNAHVESDRPTISNSNPDQITNIYFENYKNAWN
ncbi:unnamed protein product [Bursaphelenchus xylophilus]|uniref:(pine wood nematode) hypothetical protein n=1 Tax=Bursaphelenchus xylophilus TaxID=6326 RepID=A0A1I7SXA0_BURXY|nr:unnamed protein product [Bursaphelenchus xylophilus]CAG9100278.1 unnamed protein product [Bursaphelenchus xylophilus]